MRTGWLKLAAIPIASVFLAAACGSRQQERGGDGDHRRVGYHRGGDDHDVRRPRRRAVRRRQRPPRGATTTLPPTPGKGSAGKVTVFGVEDSANEAGAMQDALTEFGDANGITITYVGRRDFEQQINAQVLGGNPPDIGAFPQPGKLDAVRQGRQAAEGSRRRRRPP